MEDEIHDLFRKSDARSQARLHTLDAIMQSMIEGVLLESPEGQIVYANRSYTQFVGISPQEPLLDSYHDNDVLENNDNQLSGKLLEMIENPDAYQEALHQTEQSGEPQVVTFQTRGYYNQFGQLVPVRRDIRMRHFEVQDGAGQLIGRGKIFNDVTRQNEAEQVKKNLLAIISHELRTPLTSIKGYATSLLETDVDLGNAVQERFLRRIVEEGDRMADLVTNLLEMSQVEAGTMKLVPALHHLESLLEQVISGDEHHHIQIDIPANLPLLYVDRRRIEMVLRNIIENAKRYAGPKAVVEIAARYQANDGLYLDITDNGPGLPPHLTERIFDHFYQIDGSRERSSSGVGLGLAICRGFVGAHGGRIWAENRVDGTRGAIFHIWLPAKVLRTTEAQPDRFELHNAL
jgi:signal transduction histidine kinase